MHDLTDLKAFLELVLAFPSLLRHREAPNIEKVAVSRPAVRPSLDQAAQMRNTCVNSMGKYTSNAYHRMSRCGTQHEARTVPVACAGESRPAGMH